MCLWARVGHGLAEGDGALGFSECGLKVGEGRGNGEIGVIKIVLLVDEEGVLEGEGRVGREGEGGCGVAEQATHGLAPGREVRWNAVTWLLLIEGI